ncbi:MAG: hypothetical protein ACUVRA_04570 [Candidatus Bathyarchaeaceae archaeon]
MREREEEKRALYPPPVPGRPEERRWPSPTPLLRFPSEDVGKVLKQILERLDAIEKRLERIEKLLAEKSPLP